MTFYIGSIVYWAGSRVPHHLLPCDGRLLKVASHHALFKLIGTTYGGDGITDFKLPDLRGRTPLGSGPDVNTGENYSIGVVGGLEHVSLASDQLPNHSHVMRGQQTAGNIVNISNNAISSAGQLAANPVYSIYAENKKKFNELNSFNVSSVGGDGAHLNMQPSLAIGFFIVAIGNFPPFPKN